MCLSKTKRNRYQEWLTTLMHTTRCLLFSESCWHKCLCWHSNYIQQSKLQPTINDIGLPFWFFFHLLSCTTRLPWRWWKSGCQYVTLVYSSWYWLGSLRPRKWIWWRREKFWASWDQANWAFPHGLPICVLYMWELFKSEDFLLFSGRVGASDGSPENIEAHFFLM